MSRGTSALAAEFGGTAALLAIVIGSGVMGETLADGNVAIALLANALATGAGLFVLIATLGPISGAHFNPLVTMLVRWLGDALPAAWFAMIAMQVLGALVGVWIAHAMFDLPIMQIGTHVRASPGLWLSEFVATAGLLSVITLSRGEAADRAGLRIAAYIVAAYWFTASTSFANPAVTLARMFSDTFAGIAPSSVPAFVGAQFGALIVAALLARRVQSASTAAR